MNKVLKYKLNHGYNKINVKGYPVPLSVINQDNKIMIYIKVEDMIGEREVEVRVVGTGETFIESWRFIGTVDIEGLIWHAFYNLI